MEARRIVELSVTLAQSRKAEDVVVLDTLQAISGS